MYLPILPDILLVILGFAVLARDLFRKDGGRGSFHLAWTGLLAILVLLACLPAGERNVFFGTWTVTGFSLLFKQFFVFSSLFAILLSRSYFSENGNHRGPMGYMGEFCGLLLLATFGMFTVVSATDLLTMFIGMELATIPLYVMSAYKKGDRMAVEASVKFIVMGALATGILLFGYSLLYGAAGGLRFEQIQAAASRTPLDPLLILGVMFMVAAIGFKLTLFPFYMWAPDVYEGAPTPVTAFLSVSSKATGIAFLLVMLYGPLAPLHGFLQPGILTIAALTMTVGNLGALKQKNLRRFMAYSSIAQAGYILLAMAGQAPQGKAAILYYLFVYGAANYATFFVIAVIGRDREEVFASLRGLAAQHPGLAAILMLSMFSLAGIPPLAGFTGKFMLFAAAAERGFYFMVIFAALNSTISLYYYLLVIKEAYIVKPAGEPEGLLVTTAQKTGLFNLTAAMILLGLLPHFSTSIMQVVQ